MVALAVSMPGFVALLGDEPTEVPVSPPWRQAVESAFAGRDAATNPAPVTFD